MSQTSLEKMYSNQTGPLVNSMPHYPLGNCPEINFENQFQNMLSVDRIASDRHESAKGNPKIPCKVQSIRIFGWIE